MRILLIDQFGEMGGAQRCLAEAAAGFAERRWHIYAAVPGGDLARALAPYCVRVECIPCGPFRSGGKTVPDMLRFGWQLPVQAAAVARFASQADVVYVNGPRMLPAAALGRMNRPLIYHLHWMPPQTAAAGLARSVLAATGAHVIAASQLAARWAASSVKRNRLFVVYNGSRGGEARSRLYDGVRRIAVLGRISPEKGQREFARAARIVRARIRGVEFIICGGAMFCDESYFNQVRAAAGESVQFLPWTEDVRGFLASIDLLVVPSGPTDNIPRVILEAFGAGVPVLAFRSGAIPELIEHGETGLLAPESTSEGLAQAILSALGKPELLARIAERARLRWRESYTLARFQSEICDAVETVWRRCRKRSPLRTAGASALT